MTGPGERCVWTRARAFRSDLTPSGTPGSRPFRLLLRQFRSIKTMSSP